MGFNITSSTISLTAKLTPIGRQRFATNAKESLVTSFALGDSDANYYASNALTTGQVPAIGGEIGPNSTISNSSNPLVGLRSTLIVSGNGVLKKNIEKQSSKVTVETVANGQTTITSNNLTQFIVNRNDFNTDSLVNLFYSFGLPVTSSDDTLYTGVTYANGGYADTALSGLASTKILAIAINNNNYGESIDGKEVRLTLPSTAGTFTIYGTFQNKGSNLKVEDANTRDTSPVTANIGSNIAMLFSDQIAYPNQNPSLSWATGFGFKKPFSNNQKKLYNLQSNPNMGVSADTLVGVAYLDKGFLVITHPTIVDAFSVSASTGTSVTLNSVSTSVIQNVTCIADRGEFGGTTNPTFGPGDVPRISEVALFDNLGNIVAIAKADRQILKNINEFVALAIKIVL